MKPAEIHQATMKSGDWEYNLPRYLRAILEGADLENGEHSAESFIDRIDQMQYVPTHEDDFKLLFEVGKLLLIEFAKMSESVIGLANLTPVPQTTATRSSEDPIMEREEIDLVERALPKPMLES